MNNIIAYTILLIIVMYVLKSNIEKFAIDIGNTTAQPPSNDMPNIGNIPGLSIGNIPAQPPSNDMPSIGNIPGLSIGNTSGVRIGNIPAQPPSNDIPRIGNIPGSNDIPRIGNIPGLSIGNTTAQPTSSFFDALSASMGNTTTPPTSTSGGGILGVIMRNPSPSPASTNDLEAKVAAFCRSVQ